MSDRLPYKVGECEPQAGPAWLGASTGRCGERGHGAAPAAAAMGGREDGRTGGWQDGGSCPSGAGPEPPVRWGSHRGGRELGGAAPLASLSRLCRSPGSAAPSLPRRSEPLAGTGLILNTLGR